MDIITNSFDYITNFFGFGSQNKEKSQETSGESPKQTSGESPKQISGESPKQTSGESPKEQQGDFFKYNENILCKNSCDSDFYLSKDTLINIINGKYSKIDDDKVRIKILNIYHNFIKPGLLELINDKKKIEDLNIPDNLGLINKGILIKNKEIYKKTFNESFCSIKENKDKFASLVSELLCNIKKCNINSEDFEYIKNYIFKDINETYNKCSI